MKSAQSLVIGIWNTQWKTVDSNQGKIMAETLGSYEPEVICVTESHVNQLPQDWHACPSQADHGYKLLIDGRRKVILFSRNPWQDIDHVGSDKLPPSRFVAATTETSLGPIRFMGVCIPWSDAHVSSGEKNRVRWQDHKTYLNEMRALVTHLPDNAIFLGDFNQRVPRKYNPRDTADLLKAAFGDRFHIVTGGVIPGVAEQSIDHLACGSNYILQTVRALPRYQGEIELSDHFGLIIEIGG